MSILYVISDTEQQLIDLLQPIADGSTPLDYSRQYGLCNYVIQQCHNDMTACFKRGKWEWFQSWDEYCGDEVYPVEGWDAYDTSPHKLEGKHGDARRRLCQHIIDCIEAPYV